MHEPPARGEGAGLSHLDEAGRARMVDVSEKTATVREATARGRVLMAPETLAAIASGSVAKGDVFATARIAGIQAAKRTHELIPLCHPLALTAVEVTLAGAGPGEGAPGARVEIEATVRTTGPTGVEMEALTVYDMCKALERGMRVDAVRLTRKSGGRSGEWRAE